MNVVVVALIAAAVTAATRPGFEPVKTGWGRAAPTNASSGDPPCTNICYKATEKTDCPGSPAYPCTVCVVPGPPCPTCPGTCGYSSDPSANGAADAVITATNLHASEIRQFRLKEYAATDFGYARIGMHTLIPANMTPQSREWTGKGFQLIGPAIGAQFYGKNVSAMQQANDLVMNMTINFRYNGYVPTSESGCADKALSVYCNGTTGNQTERECQECANKLKSIKVKCHILHNPVMELPLYNCDGCNQQAVDGYCATAGAGKPPVSHHDCWNTLSANTKQCSFGLPLEQSHLVRAFSMFDQGSRFVREMGKHPWPASSQAMQREFWFGRVETEMRLYPKGSHRIVWGQWGSENIDTSNQISVYIAIDALCKHPDYRDKIMSNGKPLSYELSMWEGWAYEWLKARATSGIFVELGADYWVRTWPNILNLLDLPSSQRVRQRARMLIDIAMVEAEQASVNGLRTGQKSRAKNDGLSANMYPAMMPDLYGESLTDNSNNSFVAGARGSMVESIASTVQASNVSILAHMLGKAPDTNGAYLMRNRIIGQINATQVTTCSDARCAGTLRPPGCICAKGADAGGSGADLMMAVSDQVHAVYHTRSYSFGGVEFSPNNFFIPNTQQRWIGMIMNDYNHTALGMPHLTGEKWSLVDTDIMISTRCGSCNYGGNSLIKIYNNSQITQQCGWTFVNTTDITGNCAYAAVRPAYGGDHLTTNCSGDFCSGLNHELRANDTWSPLLLLAGQEAEYGTLANFTQAVCGVPLWVDPRHQGGGVVLEWRQHKYNFTTTNITGRYTLPSIDDVPVDVAPPFQYSGPHLNSKLGSPVVTLSYGEGYVIDYNFTDDTITRRV